MKKGEMSGWATKEKNKGSKRSKEGSVKLQAVKKSELSHSEVVYWINAPSRDISVEIKGEEFIF